MKSPMVSALTLALLILLTEHVCSHGIIASKNPLPVNSSVTLTLSLSNDATPQTLYHGKDKILSLYPTATGVTGHYVSRKWKDRTTYNSTGRRLTIRSLQVADSGDYRLDSDDSLVAKITLSVQEPVTAVKLTANITEMLEFNGAVSLSCSSSGSSLSYLWLNGSSEVTASERVQLGDGNFILTIVNVTRYDQGPFRCNVSNAISDAVSQPQNLIINYGPESMALTVNEQNIIAGSTLTLLCSAQSNPTAQIQWAFNGDFLKETGPELKLYSVKKDQSGPYSCLASNTKTNRNSSITKHITIDDGPEPANLRNSATSLHGSEHLRVCVWLLPLLLLAGVLLTLSD